MQPMTAKLHADLMGEGCQFQSKVALRTQGRAPGPLLQERQCKGPEAEVLGAGVSHRLPLQTYQNFPSNRQAEAEIHAGKGQDRSHL